MYDTLKLWIDWDKVSRANPLDILDHLPNITESRNKNGFWYSGKCGDFKVSMYPSNGVSLVGSLPKFYFGNNIQTLTRHETQKALERLSDELGFDVGLAEMKRLDVSTVIEMSRQPSDYYDCLGDKKRFERVQATKNTLYYNNHKQQLIFYDKTKEARAKNAEVPQQFAGKNLLRYESRYSGRLKQQLPIVTVSALYDEVFFRKMVQDWHSEFASISKIQRMAMNCNGINTPKNAKDAILATLLQEKGQQGIDRILADLKADGTLSSKQRSMIKSDLRELMTTTNGQEYDLLAELETKVLETRNKMLL